MREVKFRGKAKCGDYFVEGALIQYKTSSYILQGNPMITIGHNILAEVIEVIPETVEQFTNRLDKNGKEIFEHDIVRIEDSSNAIIEYSPLEAMFIFNFIGKWKIYGTWNTPSKWIEVIGNIHDNPELLTPS